jgi:cation:H+ antiporter
MTTHLLWLLAGLICAAGGGELFIRGAVGLAQWMRIPAGIVGATVAAFATSSPELSVAITSSLAGTPTLSVGDVIGSNIVNVGVVLGIALLISPIHAPRGAMKRDFPVALLIPIVIALLAMDGKLSRLDGIVLLCLFGVWFTATMLEAAKARSAALEGEAAEAVLSMKPFPAMLCFGAGLVLLVAAGRTIVTGAVGIAHSFGLNEFVIGATVVALGTSVPELATTIMAKLRGHEEVAIGTVIGSNIFNGLFITGLATVLSPMEISFRSIATGLITGCVLTACIYPPTSGLLGRRRGALLLALYAVYIVVVLQLRK